MKKRTLLIIFTLLMAFLLIGCDKIEEGISSIGQEDISEEELYKKLDRFISSPDSDSAYSALPNKLVFTGMILSEPIQMEIENEKGDYVEKTVVYGGISRNLNDVFLIDVTDVEYSLEVYELFVLTAEDVSSVYWTEEGSREEVANFVAQKIEKYEAEVGEPLMSETIAIKNDYNDGEYTFKGIDKGEDPFDEVIILYFEYKNNGSENAEPRADDFAFYNGDLMLAHSSFGIKTEADPNALQMGIMTEPTYPGKTQLYYIALKPVAGSEAKVDYSLPLSIEKYDDNFNLTYIYGFNFE